jgi:SAM-dependent methyltransferase
MGGPYSYGGNELELFRHASRWKQYFAKHLRPYIAGDVLEVGAGVAATTRFLVAGTRSWTCLEPDASLAASARDALARDPETSDCTVLTGTLDDVPSGTAFDTILYIDVIEHIDDDRAELRRASGRLRPGGHLVVLAPAHQWLYSEFDRSIGHHRRYSASTLEGAGPGLRLCTSFYLDSLGMLASSANRLLLRRGLPTAQQIRFWDDWLVRGSRWLDPLLGHRVGKTVIVVWTT